MKHVVAAAVVGALAVSSAVHAQLTCTGGFQPGSDTAIVTLPYTYDQVLSIIGSFGNLTWSGSPAGSVTLNGTDNTVGTARTYDIDGAHVVETLTVYSKPPYPGPYYEDHILSTITVPLPTGNISVYSPSDATTVTPVCNGAATQMNFTVVFCANNATAAAGLLHLVHSTDGETVGKFLGGSNFTSCAALGQGGVPTPTPVSGSPPLYTGAAPAIGTERWRGYAAASVGAMVMAWLIGI